MAEAKYTAERILWIRPWAPNLFSFRLTRPADFHFVPGQFARLGVKKPDPDNPKNPRGEKIVWRAYSIASARDAHFLEFFSIVIPAGEFTSELARLSVGGTVYVDKLNYGFFTTDRFAGGTDLWMLSTGTGLAPFLSILWEPDIWAAYENLIVVHSVRYPNELAYADQIAAYRDDPRWRAHGHKLRYVPVVTRAPAAGALASRIPALIESGALEAHVGLPLDPERGRVMVCGNPDMIAAARKVLGVRGFSTSRRGKPGQLAVENYW
ncbi:MAG TPA: ferredoxin--NADP reductase [Burkholderiaceae bacterium]|jgi:ferredoxin--NADP+ reductase|nr:ferredoxin--NADP reductase [Burkholderiaceae bacterium]